MRELTDESHQPGDPVDWWCPRCGHATIPIYRRPARRLWRQSFYAACVACDYRRPYTPTDR